jgi:ComF family protein
MPPRPTERLVRSIGESSLSNYLAPETQTLSACSAVTLLPYDEPRVRACIIEAKFAHNQRAVRVLGALAADYLAEELADRRRFSRDRAFLIPVPLSPARMRDRGCNQAERIAQCAAEILEIEVSADLIIRVRDTLPQTTLDGAARKRNVRGAFAACRKAEPRTLYILIDDVMTTGATLSEAARALRSTGASDIWVMALARG